LKFILIKVKTLVSFNKRACPELVLMQEILMFVEQHIEILVGYAGNCNNQIPINEMI